jgi:beta-glucosidase
MRVDLSFPPGFVWGTATSAYQIEGATGEDGRGESIWDRFAATPGNIRGGDTGSVASDHYHRWREDIAIMRRLNVPAYRFSIAWPRILPAGSGRINQTGLDFYDRLIDGLLEAGIEPYPTFFHWDLPQPLEDAGGWRVRSTVDAFAEYAAAVVGRLGDRVGNWLTINEPFVAAFLGHEEGIHAPGHHSTTEALDVSHHLLLAHARAVEAVRTAGASRVGIPLNVLPQVPRSSHPADVAVARYADGRHNRLYLDSLAGRGYPEDMVAATGWRQKVVLNGDLDAIAVPCDMLGVNYYNRVIHAAPEVSDAERPDPVLEERNEHTEMGWEVYPEGLYDTLARVDAEYEFGPLLVSENGAAYGVEPVGGRVADEARRSFLHRHLVQVHRAIADGVTIGGYFAWSLLDNFEWDRGYSMRFGLVHVDYDDLSRTIKDSGEWYSGVVARNAVPPLED